MTTFELDPRLAADTLEIAATGGVSVRLMDDRRWPWLVLVPTVAGAVELHDLPADTRRDVHALTDRAAAALKQATGAEKINTGALGNIVRQLHIHVVARSTGDANWPGPVWGHGRREPYAPDAAAALAARIRSALDA